MTKVVTGHRVCFLWSTDTTHGRYMEAWFYCTQPVQADDHTIWILPGTEKVNQRLVAAVTCEECRRNWFRPALTLHAFLGGKEVTSDTSWRIAPR